MYLPNIKVEFDPCLLLKLMAYLQHLKQLYDTLPNELAYYAHLTIHNHDAL